MVEQYGLILVLTIFFMNLSFSWGLNWGLRGGELKSRGATVSPQTRNTPPPTSND